MTKYTVVLDETDFTWDVVEHTTLHTIASFFYEDAAHDYVKFLTNGGAFSGWTPAFMIRKTNHVDLDNINQEFSLLV
jgi:hypothetical protein